MSVKQFIVAVTCALTCVLSQAGPAQAERVVFCKIVVNNVQSGVDAKRLAMPEEVLYDRLMQYAMGMLSAGMPQADMKRLVTAVMEGYATPDQKEKLQERLFTECMTQKDI